MTGLVWLAVGAYAAYPALPYSPVHLPFAADINSLVWAPQGWSFFTRDPREEKHSIYIRTLIGWAPILLAPHARLSNAFGLRRASRAQGVEMALLTQGSDASEWRACESSLLVCLATLPPGKHVYNTSPDPTMCGSVAVVVQKPLPWAWARSPRVPTMPSRILPLEVSCLPR